jgi:hypothetical protein
MGHIAQARARVAAQTALNKIVTSIRPASQSHGLFRDELLQPPPGSSAALP